MYSIPGMLSVTGRQPNALNFNLMNSDDYMRQCRQTVQKQVGNLEESKVEAK